MLWYWGGKLDRTLTCIKFKESNLVFFPQCSKNPFNLVYCSSPLITHIQDGWTVAQTSPFFRVCATTKPLSEILMEGQIDKLTEILNAPQVKILEHVGLFQKHFLPFLKCLIILLHIYKWTRTSKIEQHHSLDFVWNEVEDKDRIAAITRTTKRKLKITMVRYISIYLLAQLSAILFYKLFGFFYYAFNTWAATFSTEKVAPPF